MKGHGFNPRWRNFLFILWVFRFISKTSQESQVNLNFVDYALLCLRLFAISISPQSEERQVWPVGCLRAGCKIGRHQKWQRRLILKNHTLCKPRLQTNSSLKNHSFFYGFLRGVRSSSSSLLEILSSLVTLFKTDFIPDLILGDFWPYTAYLCDIRMPLMMTKLKMSEKLLKKMSFIFFW